VIRAGIVAAALAVALLGASDAQALSLQQVGPDFAQPTYVTSDPGNANRLLVVEREGTIELVENGVVSEFVDLSSEVACCEGERGLVSIALDPDFGANGRLFVDYTGVEGPGEIHVAELTAAPDRRSASPGSLVDLLTIPHSQAPTHNGGQLQFGPDGDLYVSTGDGGGAFDQFHHAQKPSDPLGKILRLDPEATPPLTPTIWSLGLRNPYRFSFDALSGDMVIGDVGQDQREEVDFAPSPLPGVVGGQGANYGWNCREGLVAGPEDDLPPGQCDATPFVDPVFDYPHSSDPELNCGGAISGGYVVRDGALGALYGRYVYSDFCIGQLRSLQLPASAGGSASGDCSLGLHLDEPVSFGEDAARRLYVVERGGAVYRITGSPPATCPLLSPPSPPPPIAVAPLRDTFLGIKAQRRRVERGKRALLTVWVSPCDNRKGATVALLRNGHSNGAKYLSRACTARFSPQIHRATTFVVFTREEHGYEAGKSRKLTIRIAHRRHHR
jgi:hypothetical protein